MTAKVYAHTQHFLISITLILPKTDLSILHLFCLRLIGCLVWLRLQRDCNETCTIKGVTIPSGMPIMIPCYAIHHEPEIWPEPEKFDPERWEKHCYNRALLAPYSTYVAVPFVILGVRYNRHHVSFLPLFNVHIVFLFSLKREKGHHIFFTLSMHFKITSKRYKKC